MINKKRLLGLLREVISIDTQNPPGNERPLAVFLRDYLKRQGFRPKILEFYPRRSNLLFSLKSRHSKKTLVVSPHLDTVPADSPLWKTNPFKLVLKEGKAFGRGTTDCKGNLCAGIEALLSLKENYNLRNLDIILCATSDEEAGSHKGLIPLLENKTIKADFWMVLDSDAFEVIIAQKGLLHLNIEIKGKPSHASIPHKGRNAILGACKSILEVYRHNFSFKRHPLLRPPTVNVGTIKGGVKTNVVAPQCSFTLDIRYLPGMSERNIIKDIKEILKRTSYRFKVEVIDNQRPIEIKEDNFWIKVLFQTIKDKRFSLRIRGSEGATVMSILNSFGINSFGFGFGAKNKAHTDNEFVYINDLYKGAEVLLDYFIYVDKVLDKD